MTNMVATHNTGKGVLLSAFLMVTAVNARICRIAMCGSVEQWLVNKPFVRQHVSATVDNGAETREHSSNR